MHLDFHQHFWTYHPDRQVWMTEPTARLRRDYFSDKLLLLLPIGVVKMQLDVN